MRGPKAPHFAPSFQALGVVINVESLHLQAVLMDNTDSRKSELIATISQILSDGRLRRKDALKLRGRLQFACGQIFGRIPKGALSIVADHAHKSRSDELSPEALFALC